MAINWREMLPHYVAMVALYGLGILTLDQVFGIDSFLSSLGVAVVVAVGYPIAVRQLGVAPSSWQHERRAK